MTITKQAYTTTTRQEGEGVKIHVPHGYYQIEPPERRPG